MQLLKQIHGTLLTHFDNLPARLICWQCYMYSLQCSQQAVALNVGCRTEKRERQQEAKAEVAAQLEKSIEKELLERLQKGVYPTDIVNINMKEYEKAWH